MPMKSPLSPVLSPGSLNSLNQRPLSSRAMTLIPATTIACLGHRNGLAAVPLHLLFSPPTIGLFSTQHPEGPSKTYICSSRFLNF